MTIADYHLVTFQALASPNPGLCLTSTAQPSLSQPSPSMQCPSTRMSAGAVMNTVAWEEFSGFEECAYLWYFKLSHNATECRLRTTGDSNFLIHKAPGALTCRGAHPSCLTVHGPPTSGLVTEGGEIKLVRPLEARFDFLMQLELLLSLALEIPFDLSLSLRPDLSPNLMQDFEFLRRCLNLRRRKSI
jgi:hypothetical protein